MYLVSRTSCMRHAGRGSCSSILLSPFPFKCCLMVTLHKRSKVWGCEKSSCKLSNRLGDWKQDLLWSNTDGRMWAPASTNNLAIFSWLSLQEDKHTASRGKNCTSRLDQPDHHHLGASFCRPVPTI